MRHARALRAEVTAIGNTRLISVHSIRHRVHRNAIGTLRNRPLPLIEVIHGRYELQTWRLAPTLLLLQELTTTHIVVSIPRIFHIPRRYWTIPCVVIVDVTYCTEICHSHHKQSTISRMNMDNSIHLFIMQVAVVITRNTSCSVR